MNKANYVIFHPDRYRDHIPVTATVMQDGEIKKNWKGNIFVDKIGEGNEDPFVLNNPWLYSYCHASQLRHSPLNSQYLQKNSIIIFVSGDEAHKGYLSIDTIFHVNSNQKWGKNPLDLPEKYQSCKIKEDNLWVRHFRFPFEGTHSSVNYTYEAKLWEEGASEFSFLPLDKNGNKVKIPFDDFPQNISEKIKGKIYRKRPVLFSKDEIAAILEVVEKETTTKVLRDIIYEGEVIIKNQQCGCGGIC